MFGLGQEGGDILESRREGDHVLADVPDHIVMGRPKYVGNDVNVAFNEELGAYNSIYAPGKNKKTHFSSVYLTCHISRSVRILRYSSYILFVREIMGSYGPIEWFWVGWNGADCF